MALEGWEDERGRTHDIPSHVNVISRGAAMKDRHYALVCHSDIPLGIAREAKRFDPALCRTFAGKIPGASQVTALLTGLPNTHASGPYEVCFSAVLIEPWTVKLVRPRRTGP